MAKLRTELTALRNALQSLVDKDDDSDVIELEDLIENIETILANSKDCFLAFDMVGKAEQVVIATTNSPDDSIHVYGCSTNNFDLELAMGILARVRKKFDEKTIYAIFMKMMGGAYDD